MTARFLLRGTGEKATIQMYFSVARNKNYRVSTGLQIDPKQWSEKEGLPKPKLDTSKNIRSTLIDLKNAVENQYYSDVSEQKEFHSDWLKKAIDQFFNKDKETFLFSDFIQKNIDNAPQRKSKTGKIGLSENSIASLKNFQKLFASFEKNKRKSYKNTEITLSVANEFKDFLTKQGYKPSSVALQMRHFKDTCSFIGQNFDIDLSFKAERLKIDQEQKKDDKLTLNFSELDRISALENLSEPLKNAQKWLLLGCELGQRAGDLLQLKETDLRTANRKYFEVIQQKTGKKVFVPLTLRAEKVLQMGFPKEINIADFSLKIKELCKLAGIDTPTEGVRMKQKNESWKTETAPKYEFVSTHICRRSFATNYYGKIPTSLLKTITGHSTEEMLLRYIGKTPQDNLEMLLEVMEKVGI